MLQTTPSTAKIRPFPAVITKARQYPLLNNMPTSSRKVPLQAGFTLIELLVVIAIIGMLSSTILASVSSARTKAKYARANSDLSEVVKAVAIAQGESGKRLQDITGHAWSMGDWEDRKSVV